MHLYSLSFLFVLLPLSALVYYLVRPRYRVLTLFVISLYFVAALSAWGLVIMLANVSLDYLMSGVVAAGRGNPRARLALFFCAAKNILLFVVLSSVSQLEYIPMPLGVIVYGFTSIGYLADLYQGEIQPAPSFYEFGLFCCFFGKLYVGPIVSYRQFSDQLRAFRPSMSKISRGVVWLLHGLGKKVLLADNAFLLLEQLRAIPTPDKTVVSVWVLVLCAVFHAYYTLSGFSDMARGVGAIFGLDLPENFHYPLQSGSVTDFFSRFNMSANRFVRKYVYRALGAEDNGALSTTLNIMLITMLMGLWYGIRLGLLVWGVFLGIFIVVETLFEEQLFQKIHPFFRHVYTFVLVIISFAFYCSLSLSQAGFYLQTMVGLRTIPLFQGLVGGPPAALINDACRYLLGSNWLLLVACGLFCTSGVSYLGHRMAQRFPGGSVPISLAVNLGLGALVLAFLV